MKVGGKREKKEKKMVCPEAAAASTVTVKVLLVLGPFAVGFSFNETSVQLVAEGDAVAVVEARVAPVDDLRATVKAPLNVDPAGSL